MIGRRAALGLMAAAVARPALAHPWAVPVPLEGLPNLHRMTPLLYRSAQPDAAGFARAEAFGIRTVISLRQTVEDARRAGPTSMRLLRVPMQSRDVGAQDGAKVVQALRLILDAEARGPVLLHCRHGADRTGTVAAVYRMAVQGWTRDEALDELLHGGFGFHAVWQNIPRYLRTVDASDIRRRLRA